MENYYRLAYRLCRYDFDWTWMWGVLFWYWAIPSILNRETYFMERIGRKEDPILYWVVVLSWVVIGGLCFWGSVTHVML